MEHCAAKGRYSTYVHIYGLEEGLRPAGKTKADAGRENFRETVKPQYAPDLWLFKLQRKVGRVPSGIAVVQEVVWVIYANVNIC